MPNYLSPGVYVEEVEAGSRPIEGVGTAVAAFVGLAGRGPANTPTLVTNWNQFTSTFGDFIEGSYLAHAVYGYFLNGGGAAYVVRVGADGVVPTATAEVPSSTDKAKPAFQVAALEAGPEGNDITVDVQPAADEGSFKLVVKRGGREVESFDNLTTAKGKQNVATVVKAQSKTITIEEAGALAPAAGSTSLAGGSAAVPSRVTPDDYVGNSADRTGFAGLEAVDEVTMLAVPDLMAVYEQGMIDLEGLQAVHLAMIAHCELMGDRVAILDAPPGLNAQQIKEWRVDKAGYDSKYATLYWPWIKVFDPLSGQAKFVPPSGHVGGIWARNDDTRGVHKAPANEVVRGAISLALNLTKAEHDQLNPNGINCIRAFPGRGIRVWGARTHLERPVVALPERPAAVQLHRGVDLRGHPVGGLRAQRPAPVGPREADHQRVPPPGLARRRAVRRDARPGVLRQVRRGEQPARGPRRGAADHRHRHRPREAGRVRRLPHRPVLRLAGRRVVAVMTTAMESHGGTDAHD